MIGTLLNLPKEELNIIEANYPTNVKWCCNKMLEIWLELDPNASWEKLFAALESPAVSIQSGIMKVIYVYKLSNHNLRAIKLPAMV